jgi:hypothetical protein
MPSNGCLNEENMRNHLIPFFQTNPRNCQGISRKFWESHNRPFARQAKKTMNIQPTFMATHTGKLKNNGI